MSTTDIDTSTREYRESTINVTYEVSGHPAFYGPFARVSTVAAFVVVRLEHTAEMIDGDTEIRVRSITVHGRRGRKDGTPTALDSTAEFWMSLRRNTEMPAWLADLANDAVYTWATYLGARAVLVPTEATE